MASDSRSQRVLVFGAAGFQGGPVARTLLSAGYTVVAAGRDPEKLDHLRQRGAQIARIDLNDPKTVREAASKVAYAFFHAPMGLTGEGAVDREAAALQSLLDAGVEHLVYNVGFAMPGEPLGVPPLDERINLVETMRSTERVTVLVPTGYLENFLAPWSAPHILRGELAYPLAPDVRVKWVTNEDVGACTAAAFRVAESKGARLRVAGPESLTLPEVAAQIGEALGHEVRLRQVSGSEYAGMLEPYVGREVAEMVGSNYDRMANEQNPLMTPETGETEQLLGVRFTSVVDWAKRQNWR
jgi:uncharacterized protein YbjT (DUF2867 family)